MSKNAIFSYFNFQINPEIAHYQQPVVSKLVKDIGIDYHPLQYNAKDGDMYPDQVIDYGLNELFYNQKYDNVLVLDIDCIPLDQAALTRVFYLASRGTLVGNVQRSHYINNDEHLFVGSSCMCINKQVYEQLGKPSMSPTSRGDIGEEFVYRADELGVPVEFFYPHSYEASPYGVTSWALKGDLPHYGIGTTFGDDRPRFYHLFESRTNLNVHRFVAKCQEVLNSDK
jgi:hypothetical protein